MVDNNNVNDDLTICVKRTQEILGKYIKKPSLTEKLLKKPPFRFLHDIIHVIIRDTGYFGGLYTEEELKSDNIKDREGKMQFLQKIIDVVSKYPHKIGNVKNGHRICAFFTVELTTNAPLTVKTSKIVAGLEPNKTNELLQLIGEIIDKQLNWKVAVQSVMAPDHGQSKDQVQDESQTRSKQPEDYTKKHLRANKGNKDESKRSKQRTKISEENVNMSKNKDIDKSKRKPGISDEKPSNKESNSKRIKEKDNVQSKQQIASKVKDIVGKDSNRSKEQRQQAKATVKKAESDAKLASDSALATNGTIVEKQQQQQQKEQRISSINQVNERIKPIENIAPESSPNQTIIENQTSIEKKTDVPVNMNMPVPSVSNEFLTLPKEEIASSANKKPLQNEKLNGTSVNDENKNSTAFMVNHGISNDDTNNEQEKQQKEEYDEKESKNLQAEALQTVHLNKTTAKSNDIKEASTIQTVNTTIISTTPTTITTTTTTTATSSVTKANIRRQSTFTRSESNPLDNESTESVRARTSSLRPPSVRPPSARPGAPRRRDKNIEIILQPNEQIQMAGVNIKLDTYNTLGDVDDDGDNLVIIESTNSVNDDNNTNTQTTTNNIGYENEMDGQEDQGFLVQQILETQREFMKDNPESTQQNQQKNTKNLSQSLITRQTSAHTVNNLRENLIELSKSINSLSKLMEFIPEDIDAMQLEITMWRDAYTQATIELQKEKSLTESSTEPLKNQLTQIEANIVEYTEMIDSSRARILQNTEKIFNLYNVQ